MNNLNKIVEKVHDVQVKFKSMQDILNIPGTYFDGNGNLCASGYRTMLEEGHLAPSYFSWLGKTVTLKSHHSFPRWCIESQYQDMFQANMALRAIAGGTLDKDEAVALAEKAVLVK